MTNLCIPQVMITKLPILYIKIIGGIVLTLLVCTSQSGYNEKKLKFLSQLMKTGFYKVLGSNTIYIPMLISFQMLPFKGDALLQS